MKKHRIDQVMLERQIVKTRSQAQSLIKAQKVLCNNETVQKNGHLVGENDVVRVTDEIYVSRGAYKLVAALENFQLSVAGKVCVDIGASTGGFTQVLLQKGARKVFAIDVGQGQLHSSLTTDSRVVNMEKTDIRSVENLADPVDFVVIDLSFISLRHVLKNIHKLIHNQTQVIALIKPQFEDITKKGIVRSDHERQEILQRTLQDIKDVFLSEVAVMTSPITGKDGNVEFLAFIDTR